MFFLFSLHGIRLVASAVKVRDADKLQLLRAGIAERSLSVLSLVRCFLPFASF
jgi:hypothetical protein